jgi:hypothetical protein
MDWVTWQEVNAETRVHNALGDLAGSVCQSLSGGHMAVLTWAREYHCPWDEWTCAGAVLSGNLVWRCRLTPG